ncbi:hypothetical protein ANTHELSMS3_00428 [Antarctobacter heliothermus]|uniref:Uncharacterized protein n=2 Tax=Antarctobacter heliothermus TaxID=74033 RepID=A0A222DZL9_9RHOB|nr:hypothetical protein ANTHELSMS3_00428 [Antarctobacter heliothermus]
MGQGIRMKHVVLLIFGLILAGPGAAQDQIVLPDDGTEVMQSRPSGGTGMTMRRVEVQGQKQLRGRYGSAWTAQDVKEQAAKTCAEGGLRLIYFKPAEKAAGDWTEFAAVCQ